MKFLSSGRTIIACGLILSSYSLVAQEFPITLGGTQTANSCQTTLILTDSNADDGNYGPNESEEITVCFQTLAENPLQFSILPTNSALENIWDVDADSELYVYEGTGTAGDLIGVFNSISDPDGVFFTTDATCLTFVFLSGESSSGLGFIARITCVQELQPFNVNVLVDEPHSLLDYELPGLEGQNVITFCYGDTISFNAIANFPLSDATGNGYEQLIEETLFTWNMGDGTVVSGLNLTEFEHEYTQVGGFYARLFVEDVNGQVELYEAYILSSPRVIFSNDVFNDTLCIGDTTQITGGILGLDTVGVGPNTGIVNLNVNFTDSIAIPDILVGQPVDYFTSIDIFGYSGNPIITDPGDFVEICMNIEHSYIGDLEAYLVCPNGSEVLLFDGFDGPATGQFFGDATDSSLDIPGIGFDYCYNENATFGTLMEEVLANNTMPVTEGNAMVPGTYLPEESFDPLIGCPVNGEWSLRVRDNLGIDDGFIFSWGLLFTDEFTIDTIYYTPQIVDAYWLDNNDIVQNNDTIITVVPSVEGNNAFTFEVLDSFGCYHDTTYFVYVRPDVFIADNIACDLTHFLDPENATAGGEWNVLQSPNETSVIEFGEIGNTGFVEIEANDYGLYDLEIVEFNCGYRDTATIDFRPVPVVAPFVPDTILCIDASIVFDAGPQEDNSDNFFINWTLNGSTFNTEDYAITADQTGQYILTLTDVCGSATDTSDVVAIQLSFDPVTICGLQAFTEAELSPEGNGTWTSDDDIIFSNPNDLFTEVNSSTYGPHEITFTDSRCLNDGVSQTFTFVEQPTVEVLLNPDFCVELDSLIISTSVSGDDSGIYLWSVTGEEAPNIVDQNDSLFFGPETFVPLETYTFQVQVFDNFGVCNVATGSNSFEATWCTYTVPNIITPNGDGMNDSFMIEHIQFFPGTHMRIFNRWGNVVFDQPNFDQFQTSTQGWVPEDLTAGTYFYEISIPHAGKVETGNLTIVKDQ